jgi:transposase InsO family protein
VTYVATWSGFAYVAFVTDVYSRRIVGWNVAATLSSEILPMQELDMAAWNAGGRLDSLIHHADHGSNYTAMVYTDRIVELGAVPSTGTVGDSFDNAMAEAVNNLYKTELIRQRGPWRTVEQVELATLGVGVVVEQLAPPRRTRHAHPDRGRERVLRRPGISPTGTGRTKLPIATKVRPIHPTFGYRCLADEARRAGWHMSRRTAWKLCSQAGILSSAQRRRRGKGKKTGPPLFDDHVRRQFHADAPNWVWLTDITEH